MEEVSPAVVPSLNSTSVEALMKAEMDSPPATVELKKLEDTTRNFVTTLVPAEMVNCGLKVTLHELPLVGLQL